MQNPELSVMLGAACTSLRTNWAENSWVQSLCNRAEELMAQCVHGDLSRWSAALRELPQVACNIKANQPAPSLGEPAPDPDALRASLMAFHPWRKGPLELAGVMIDTEWRSDWKWQRVQAHVDVRSQRILDVGCGNGYFGWRMLAEGARLVVGIDPTLVFVMQWLACRHFAGDVPNYVLPMSSEELPTGAAGFDTVFSMGVLYHRKNAQQHLTQLHSLIRPGGTLVLESLVLPKGDKRPMLIPRSRYARMRNVWSIPAEAVLLGWVRSAGFANARIVNVTVTSTEEQGSTNWMTFESLAQALDPEDHTRTLEGHPAPTRALIIAQR